jgi:alcohol dehydrogenase YqhD (iron-dependent ADH family)
MKDFCYASKTEIIFGESSEDVIAEAIFKRGGRRVLVCYGQASAVKSGILERVLKALTARDVGFDLHGGISANPLLSHAMEGIDIAASHESDFVLAIGGGSVIDEAKFIAAGAKTADIWDYYTGKNGQAVTEALPIGVVLTLPAAGSEGSTHSVIRDDSNGEKFSLGAEVLRPAFAVVNPDYCLTLPREQIAFGASDILAHLMERYFSPQENVAFTDHLLAGAIRAMLEIAPKLYAEPKKRELWAEFCLIGTLAHNGMLDLGRPIQDWATHGIENKIVSGVYNLAHGAGLAILFPAWLKLVSKTKPKKIQQFALDVFGVSSVSAAISKLEAFYKSLGLVLSLNAANINAEDAKTLAKEIFPRDVVLGGYGELNLDQILEIIELAK